MHGIQYIFGLGITDTLLSLLTYLITFSIYLNFAILIFLGIHQVSLVFGEFPIFRGVFDIPLFILFDHNGGWIINLKFKSLYYH